jgi:hypothetical protein
MRFANKKILHFLAFFIALVWSARVDAINYAPLSEDTLPLIPANPTLPQVLNAIMGWSVGLAAILAVIMLAIGGFNYMTSESVFKMGDSKEKISNAIVGLLIVLGAVFLLGYINPEITSMNLDFSRTR